ncbi:putative membrane protein [Bacillus phage SP-15]|uniref:Putative membrane protein n=1 Tax=Bacillus phage SP-15 TaxID=1792032 RepID=A0A127AXV3_9CAUD|nr:hypothetical protein SP15_239B [Bacillus phage SP-15]AMM45044.1 putative membrane protein [Bacillus phage SP-15]
MRLIGKTLWWIGMIIGGIGLGILFSYISFLMGY